MELQAFIDRFDQKGSIVLLEGKRDVAEADIVKLTALGKLLAENTRYIIFRSGNASGADEYFSEGVVSVDKSRLQVIAPYDGHRKKQNLAAYTMALDQINMVEESELVYAARHNPSTAKLVDDYVAGKKIKTPSKPPIFLGIPPRCWVAAIGARPQQVFSTMT